MTQKDFLLQRLQNHKSYKRILNKYSMASFHRRVDDRIKSLKSFREGTIKRINKLNVLILEALKKRSRFPVCRAFFEQTPQRELEELGINTVSWGPLYSKIAERVCEEGDYVEGVEEAEAELEELVHERIYIGEKVIGYKAPRGFAITRKPREEEIINQVRNYASANEMNPDSIEGIFRLLIDKNKHVQSLLKKQAGDLPVVASCKTSVPDLIEGIKKDFELKAQKLKEETGETYFIVVKEKKEPLLHYVVELVQG